MTTHHPIFCIHTVLQLVGLTTEKLLPTALISKLLRRGQDYKYIVLFALSINFYLVQNYIFKFQNTTCQSSQKKVLVAKEVLQANGKGKRKKLSDDQHTQASQSKKQCTLWSTNVPSTRLYNLLSEYCRYATIVNCRITCLLKVDWTSLLYTSLRGLQNEEMVYKILNLYGFA